MIEITYNNLPEAVTNLQETVNDIKRLLLEKDNKTQVETDQVLTIKEAAEVLCLSVPTIYGLVSRSEIPVSKKGKRLYFSKQELIKWIREGRKKTVSEIASEADTYLKRKK